MTLFAFFSASSKIQGKISLDGFNPRIGNLYSVYSVIQPDGKIIVAGRVSGEARVDMFRLNADGSVDNTFNPPLLGNPHIRALAVLPDGKLLFGGGTVIANGNPLGYLIRFNADGSLDETFQYFSAENGFIFSVHTLRDGKIILGGSNLIEDQPQKNIVRLNSDGSPDKTFVAPNFDRFIFSTTLLDDGKLLVGGNFSYVNGSARSCLVRLNSDGTLDETFNSLPFDPFWGFIVSNAAPQPDGKILIGGYFGIQNSKITTNTLIRLNSDGTLDYSFPAFNFFDINATPAIISSALQSDGKIVLAGRYTNINHQGFMGISRLNANGTVDNNFPDYQSLNINAFYPIPVSGIALQKDGKILFTGDFNYINSHPRLNIARITNDSPAINYLSATSSEIKWIRGGSSPMLERTDFDYSIDGVNYTPLGAGKRDGFSWTLNNLNLPVQQNIRLRARGVYRTGYYNGSQSMTETTRNVFLTTNSAIRTPFDFDGDGRADVSVFRADEGNWFVQQSSNGFSAFNFGSPTDLLTPADFDGDGKTDVAVFRAGVWYYLQSSDNAFKAVTFGQAADIPRPADFDGDGKADINVFRPAKGTWYRLNSSNGAFVANVFGQNGDKPLIADFDGDGQSDIAVFRPSANGAFYWLESSTGTFRAISFGFGMDIPTMGDFDGDGKTDIAVFRPLTGAWYRYDSLTGVFVGVAFGQNGDIPVTADFDGDGKADIAVFRPSNGAWYYLQSSNGGFVGLTFGISTDKAIPASFLQ